MGPSVVARSYRALLGVPSLGRVLLGMQLARIAQTMVSVALVLFTLTHYGSPALTGLVIFVSLVPGLLISPLAGALLDRHGRTRLIIVDFVVALVALAVIGLLALMGELPAWLLVLIVGVASLTNPLSSTGLRSLFPILVPPHLWERVNAVDSNGYIVASIIGPPLAAGLVALVGAPVTLIGVGAVFERKPAPRRVGRPAIHVAQPDAPGPRFLALHSQPERGHDDDRGAPARARPPPSRRSCCRLGVRYQRRGGHLHGIPGGPARHA
jgi:MFS family permease